MPNSRPDPARTLRRFALPVASLLWMAGALAAPDAPREPPRAFPLVDSRIANPPSASFAPVGDDPLPRLLADKAPIDASTPEVGAGKVDPKPGETRFVERFRDQASDMVLTAMDFLGVPYRRGGDDADRGFDCSGFTRHVFEMSLGLVLPRRAEQQATGAGLLHIGREQLKPGDLVFFNTMRRTFSHVGIYVGAGKFIHSPKPGAEVRVDDLHAAYWEKRFTGGRRADSAGNSAPEPTLVRADALN